MAERQVYDGSTGLVFLDELGRPVSPDASLRRFKSLSKKAGLRPVRIHDLRHSYASALLASGASMKVIGERLRHAGSESPRTSTRTWSADVEGPLLTTAPHSSSRG